MNWPVIATSAIVLWGTTLLVIFSDRAYRNRRPAEAREDIPPAEPSLGLLLLLTVACNAATLPVYFYQTRGKWPWLLVGLAAFFFCFVAASVASIAVNIALDIAS